MAAVSLTCAFCLGSFEKEKKEYDRQVRRGRERFYCGQACSGHQHNREHPQQGNQDNLVADNRRDSLTPFRWFLARARHRKHKGHTDLTAEYLLGLPETQQGMCPFTGWPLTLPASTEGWVAGSSPQAASLDRLDHTLGYLQGNVRFVSLMANYARNTFTDAELASFCTAVHHHGRRLS